jgi:hypothetical protein
MQFRYEEKPLREFTKGAGIQRERKFCSMELRQRGKTTNKKLYSSQHGMKVHLKV